jgi:hypothetical protein
MGVADVAPVWTVTDVACGMSRAAAERQVRVSGDADLGRHVLSMIAIVG